MDRDVENDIFQVKTPKYEGPFALLLSLIEERKLFINEISLAKVTEDYLNHLEKMKVIETEKVSSFVFIASTLILIKSRSILPNLNLTEEEEEDIENLEERLKLYEKYSNYAFYIKKLFGDKMIFFANERKREDVVFVPDTKINIENMHTLALNVLNTLPKKEKIPEVEVKKIISIEEMIQNLTTRIQEAVKFSFKDFAGKAENKEQKVFVIVSFLAVLELARQGMLSLIQDGHFDDITVEKLEVVENVEVI